MGSGSVEHAMEPVGWVVRLAVVPVWLGSEAQRPLEKGPFASAATSSLAVGSLRALWALLGPSWALLGPSWALLAPSRALPETPVYGVPGGETVQGRKRSGAAGAAFFS